MYYMWSVMSRNENRRYELFIMNQSDRKFQREKHNGVFRVSLSRCCQDLTMNDKKNGGCG